VVTTTAEIAAATEMTATRVTAIQVTAAVLPAARAAVLTAVMSRARIRPGRLPGLRIDDPLGVRVVPV
jgi:hypothetical protein